MNENLELVRKAQSGDTAAMEKIAAENSGLIWAIVKRYHGANAEAEDLFQLGCVGLIKAVQGFNFTYKTQFSTYAVPKIAGEIRRFLRDDGALKVGRTIREKGQVLWSAKERLCHQLGREPTLSELSAETGLSVEDISDIELANVAPESLQQEISDGLTLETLLGTDSPEEETIERIALRQMIEKLREREKEVILLRYYKNLTQQQVARILKISQVQVSRLERRSVEKLRELLA